MTRWLILTLLLTASPAHPDDLGALMRADGGQIPPDLKALVTVYGPTDVVGRRYTLGQTATDASWWPASTIKIFAAVAALESAHADGVGPRARLSFDRGARKPYVRRLDWLVKQAITHSSNLAYDRLVQFVGAAELHANLLGPKRGMGHTALQVPYSTNISNLLESPAITIIDGARRIVRPTRRSDGVTRCAMSTCSTLDDLSEIMRRVLLDARLPAADRLRMRPAALQVLRTALAKGGARGQEVVQAVRAAFGRRRLRVYHKPGYYPDWRSDIVGVQEPATGTTWIIALANSGGRKALNRPAKRLARLMAQGKLPPGTPTADR